MSDGGVEWDVKIGVEKSRVGVGHVVGVYQIYRVVSV